jgi:hypothetical protein
VLEFKLNIVTIIWINRFRVITDGLYMMIAIHPVWAIDE